MDSGVESLNKVKQQLTVYRQAVLKEAFEGKLTAEWRETHQSPNIDEFWKDICSEREKSHFRKKFKMIENITLPALPHTWKWVNIGDISTGPEYGTSQKSSKSGDIPVIRMGNLQNGRIEWDNLVYTSNQEEIAKYNLKKNDVLFNRTNSAELVGKTAIYRGEQKAIFAGYLIRINQLNCIDPDYLTYYMNSFVAKRYGNRVKTDGVNQSNISGQKLCSYPFPLCTPMEQEQVVSELKSRLSVCDNIAQTVDTALQQAEAMRQSILKRAFEGGL